MKTKVYQKPTMKVVKLQQRTHLLMTSGFEASRSGYGTANVQTWGGGDPAVKANRSGDVWDDDWSKQ